MKTKNKLIALMEIAIVLCSMFLVAIPAIAAGQNQGMQKVTANTITTASEDDYVLSIYGNANEDDTIDMGDVVYTKLAIFGKKSKTELCDAKYDGRINVLDVIQTKLIILEKEKELTFICDPPYGKEVTIHKPVKSIILLTSDSAEAVRILNAQDKVVGVASDYIDDESVFFSEFSELPTVGSWFTPDLEAILNLNPDIVMIYGFSPSREKLEDKFPENIKVVRFRFYMIDTLPEKVRKLGYILDKRDEAEEFIDWYEDYMGTIKSRTEGLSDDKKPRVYGEWNTYYARTKNSAFHLMCVAAGGINIAADISKGGYGVPNVDPEWVIEQNPDVIIRTTYAITGFNTDDPSGMAAIREEIMSRPELAKVNAVQNGKVYTQDYLRLTQGPGCLIGTAYFAKWFHPDLFEDFDPKAIHQEYVTRFQHLDYDLDKHGVFVYPPLED